MKLEQIKMKTTNHALDRAKEFGLSHKKLTWMFWHSDEDDIPKDLKRNKGKYGEEQNGVFYRRYETIIFVCKKVIDFISQEPIYLIITLCDQRINLKSCSDF